MSRREEIIAEAKKHEYDWGIDVDRFDVPDIFAKGAEWADKTMIEKACRVLDEMTEGRLGKRFLNEFRGHLEE